MDVKKALFISQEISPYLPENTMSTLCRLLPQGVQENGAEVRTFMPRYGAINERRNQLHEVIRLSGINLLIDDTDHPLIIKVATLQPSRMQVYFIDSDDYFRRSARVLETDADPGDNDERLIFYSRGVIETVKKLRWAPDFIHCSGWMSALAPMYLRTMYANDPIMRDAKVIYSLFDNEMPAPLDQNFVDKLKMDNFTDEDIAEIVNAETIDAKALQALAIRYADAIVEAVDNVNPELVELAKKSGKPFLGYPGAENYINAYNEFYKNL